MQWAFIFRASISIIGTDRYPIECLSLLYCVCRTIKQCWYLGFAICAEQRPFEDDFVLFSLSSVCIILGRQCDIVNEVPPLIHCAAYLWSTKQFPTPAPVFTPPFSNAAASGVTATQQCGGQLWYSSILDPDMPILSICSNFCLFSLHSAFVMAMVPVIIALERLWQCT